MSWSLATAAAKCTEASLAVVLPATEAPSEQ